MTGTKSVAGHAGGGVSARKPRRVRASLTGAAAGVSVAALLIVLPAAASLAAALVLVAVAPTSSTLARRLTLNVAILLGLAPVVLLAAPKVDPRVPAIGVVSLGLGLAAAVALLSPQKHPLWPAARRRDLAVAGAGIGAAIVAGPLVLARRADQALATLSTGIDNGYHFSIFLERRLASVESPLVAARADGSGFAFDDYPQWFHRGLATFAQWWFGAPGTAETELVRYSRIQWLVFVLLLVLVTAALLQALPDETPTPLTVAGLAVVWSLFLGVPGGLNLLQGHLSFLVAASGPLVLLLIGASSRRDSMSTWVARAALLLAASAWMLLTPLALAALAPALGAVWRARRPVLRWSALLALTTVGILAALIFIVPWVNGSGLQALLRDGTVPRVWPWALTVIILATGIALFAIHHQHRALPLAAHVLVVGVAAAELTALAAFMLYENGELTYYFWKLGLASLIVTIGATTHAALLAASELHAPSRARLRLASVATVVLAALGLGELLQDFTGPSAAWAALIPASVYARTTSGDAGDVDLVLRLARETDPQPAARTRLLATRPNDMNAGHALVWFHALSHSSTHRAMDANTLVYDLAEHPDDISLGVEIVELTLEQPDRRVVVTDSGLAEAARTSLSREQADRLQLEQ